MDSTLTATAVGTRNELRVAIRPATEADVPALWAWMHEDWWANADDYAPSDLPAFTEDIRTRLNIGERIWVAEHDGAPVGAIGYRTIGADTGMLHGVCFTARVHGYGVARKAMQSVLAQLRTDKVRKVSAAYFADNRRVRGFLAACGFEDEGYLYAQTVRRGSICDLYLVAQLLR